MKYDEEFRNRGTTLNISLGMVRVRVTFLKARSQEMRHALALAIFGKVAEVLGYADIDTDWIRGCNILHHTGSDSSREWALKGLRTHQASRLDTEEEKLGFRIRMLRLKFGLSQDVFAKEVQLTRSHLSRIERGRVQVKGLTLKRIESALARHLEDSPR